MPVSSIMSATINYDLVLDTALTGVRRAAVFMGLGLNAALDHNYKNYELSGIAALQLIPANADEATITRYKENFALWITANGLRELIEAFSIFLDQVYDANQLTAPTLIIFTPVNDSTSYSTQFPCPWVFK